MSTQIKRLYQSNKEFVPITLQEAVVVNSTNIPGLQSLGITTLDKVLRQTMGIVSTNTGAISTLETTVANINTELGKKQNQLVAGTGITLTPLQDGRVGISTSLSYELYKVVTELPAPSAECLNSIYLVTSVKPGYQNQLSEYICIQDGSNYRWEQFGTIQADTDLSNYITKDEFTTEINKIKTALASTISAEDVTTKAGNSVIVTYDIPADLYDSMVQTNDGDQITT